MLVGKALK